MAWRKWVVRSLVFGALGLMGLVAVAYQWWTNPEAVRRQVLERLERDLRGCEATVESARLSLLGGIEVHELRVGRKDSLDRGDFLHVPSATVYHDKERLLDGALSVRKLEIRNPRLRVVRGHDGRWNLAGLTGPSDLTRRMPSVVIRRGTVLLEDKASPGSAPVEVRDVELSVHNDPLPVVVFEGSGTCDGVGKVKLSGRFVRGGGGMTLSAEAADVRVGPDFVKRVAGYCPGVAEHVQKLRAAGRVKGTLTWNPHSEPALSYSVAAEVADGSFAHPTLPKPLENVRGELYCVNGSLPSVRLMARAGGADVALTLKDVRLLPRPASWAEGCREVELEVKHFPVDDGLFDYLPAGLRGYREEYAPDGGASLSLKLVRGEGACWHQKGRLTAHGGRGVYRYFRYPVRNVTGTIGWDMTIDMAKPAGGSFNAPEDRVDVDLVGEAGGRPVTLKGSAFGPRGTGKIDFDLRGEDFPLDERLLKELPARSQAQARAFHPAGRLDFRVQLRRTAGQAALEKRFLVHLHDCTARYDVFRLPLKNLSGTLDMRGDTWEFRDFVGYHNGGVVRASGRGRPAPARAGPLASGGRGPPRQLVACPLPAGGEEESEPKPPAPTQVSVVIRGEALPIDDEFRAALAPGREGLAKAFDTFALTGRLSFEASIDDLPDQPRDIDMRVSVGGCKMKPRFFAYALENVAATLHYARGNVWVSDFSATHGATNVRVRRASVCLPKEGGFWAKLDRVEARGLALDADLQKAMPPALAKLARMLKPNRPLDLSAVLVVKQAPGEGARPVVYWNALAGVRDTDLTAGVEWKHVTGTVASEGLHNGTEVEDVISRAYLERATVFGQPLKNVLVPMVVRKDSADVLRLPGFKAELFGGTVGGEGMVTLGSVLRYELDLRAAQVQMEQLGRHNFKTTDMSGLANGGLHVEGRGAELAGLQGKGYVEVPSGKLYRLPLLLDLLKWLGLQLPDRTAFEQARVVFAIDGPRLTIEELDLYGKAISVRGGGTMNLDGSAVKLDLNADLSRWPELLPPGLKELTRELSNQLLRVKVRGRLGDVKFENEILPAVSDPLKKLWKGITPATPGEAMK